MEDSKIIELFNKRDETAVRAISEKYGALCASVSRNILQNSEDVEECLNDTYMRAWESIPPANPKHLSSYLAKIAKNISLNRYKSVHCEKRGGGAPTLVLDELTELEPFAAGGVAETAERRELLDEINRFLGGLKKEKRIIFVRRYWYCDEISELAAAFGMSENSVFAVLSRTRAELKKHLKKRGYGND